MFILYTRAHSRSDGADADCSGGKSCADEFGTMGGRAERGTTFVSVPVRL
jgi:hypothetical protein